MDTARITEILTDPVTLDLVEKQPITQIAYTATDGGPRAVPLDGVPEEYLEASFRTMPGDQHAGFEQQVRALYDSMVRIEVSPTWVRLNDFQRTAPRAVERLVQAKQGATQR